MGTLQSCTFIPTENNVIEPSSLLEKGDGEPVTLPLYPERPVGTKLRWVRDLHNYCVAIVKKNGILQVKCAKGEGLPVSYTTQHFPDENAWRESLDPDGIISIEKIKTELEKRVERPLTSITDARKLRELQWRFYERTNPHTYIDKNTHTTLPAYLTDTQKMGYGYSKILLLVGQDTHEVSYAAYKSNSDGLPIDTKEKKHWIFDHTTKAYYRSFGHINSIVGPCLNEKGQPRLSVIYKNERIHLGSLF